MRSELKEVIRRMHSKDYQKLLAAEKPNGQSRRNGPWRRLIRWTGVTGTQASRALKVLLAVIIVTLGIYIPVAGIYYYNRFSLILVGLDKCESLVDNELKRRANLLPNLLIISAEYRAHEKRLYEYVSEMRTYLSNLKKEMPSDSTLPLSKIMSSLLAVAEEYPELKATQSFEKLMDDWTETEDRIAQARVSYIESIRELNALCTTFPSNVYAQLFTVGKRDPFAFREPGAEPIDSTEFFSSYFADDTARGGSARDGAGTGRSEGALRSERRGNTDSGLDGDAGAKRVDAGREDAE